MQRGACGLLFACMIGRISGFLHGFLEVGGGGEADDAAGRDLDFLTRVRVAADAGGAFGGAKRAEADEANVFALGNGFNDDFTVGVDELRHVGLGETGLGLEGGDKFGLVHFNDS